jgi:N-methylhydantoinase B
MPGNAIRIGRFLGTDLPAQLASGAPLPERLEDIGGRHEIMASKHERGPIDAGDVWYHCWQAGGGYGDPLLRDCGACALDVARGAVSRAAAHGIYGVVLTDDGTADEAATQAQRQQIRQDRIAASVPIEAGDAVVSFPGAGRLEFGDVLLVDGDADSVSCAQCGHRHCGTSDNLLDHIREVCAPLTTAGPVRGEDYDVGRFHLRQLCCTNCGTLVDVQVALDGAPRPFMWIGTP